MSWPARLEHEARSDPVEFLQEMARAFPACSRLRDAGPRPNEADGDFRRCGVDAGKVWVAMVETSVRNILRRKGCNVDGRSPALKRSATILAVPPIG